MSSNTCPVDKDHTRDESIMESTKFSRYSVDADGDHDSSIGKIDDRDDWDFQSDKIGHISRRWRGRNNI